MSKKVYIKPNTIHFNLRKAVRARFRILRVRVVTKNAENKRRIRVKVINRKIFGRFTGIALYPYALVSKQSLDGRRTVNHEVIHCYQQAELWWIGFLILYGLFWIWYGYKNNPFEKESRENNDNNYYCNTREKFAWKKML